MENPSLRKRANFQPRHCGYIGRLEYYYRWKREPARPREKRGRARSGGEARH
jgi:hypothetical protein